MRVLSKLLAVAAVLLATGMQVYAVESNSKEMSVNLRVEERWGVSRTNMPMTGGVAFAQGPLRDTCRLILCDEEGKLYPLQVKTLSKWHIYLGGGDPICGRGRKLSLREPAVVAEVKSRNSEFYLSEVNIAGGTIDEDVIVTRKAATIFQEHANSAKIFDEDHRRLDGGESIKVVGYIGIGNEKGGVHRTGIRRPDRLDDSR